ncbi:MAG: zf-HC2 domain-containing protein [Fibrobacterota bacterium]|nr:zf-HC2 domain-containing protein [Fibrobacterota bacterium]
MHVSRLVLAQMLAGDLDSEAKSALENHLAGCSECAGKYREAVHAAEGFAAKYPTREYLAATRRSKRNPSAARPTLLDRLLGGGAGARGLRPALALILILAGAGVLYRLAPMPSTDNELSTKGDAITAFYLFVNGKRIQGDTVYCKPRDTLQLGITGAKPVHYVILYRDDRGPLRAYMSANAQNAAPIGGPKGQNLPNSLVLDSGWTRETIYCVWSPSPFGLEAAKALAEGAPPAAASSLQIRSYLLINQIL